MSKLILEVDGSTRGSNPGPSTWGFVALDQYETVIYQDCGPVGWATSNEAEYQALIEGLRFAHDLGFVTQVTVRSDSRTMVNQMVHRYTEPTTQRRLEAFAMVAQFEKVDLVWVPRKWNGHADRLAAAAWAPNPRAVMKTIQRSNFEVLPASYSEWYDDSHD